MEAIYARKTTVYVKYASKTKQMSWLLSEFQKEIVEYMVVIDNKKSRTRDSYIQFLAYAIF